MENGTVINQNQNPKQWYQKPGFIILAGILVLIAIFSVYGASKRNQFITDKQNILQQQGQIQTVLQRRADLIPNLVNSIKGSQNQEKSVYGEIADARKDYSNAKSQYDSSNSSSKQLQAMEQQERSLNIMVKSIKEAYPDLGSNKQVSDLMVELEGSENRISVERRKYNQLVQTYNTDILKFPASLIASMSGNQQMDYFKADSSAQDAPKVNFNN